jgi:hypothetical protein
MELGEVIYKILKVLREPKVHRVP